MAGQPMDFAEAHFSGLIPHDSASLMPAEPTGHLTVQQTPTRWFEPVRISRVGLTSNGSTNYRPKSGDFYWPRPGTQTWPPVVRQG